MPGPAGAAAGGDADGGEGPPPAPRLLQLRPFRSHVCVIAGGVELCMLCMSKAPRFRTPAWRAQCCDGTTPIGAVPKHMLAAIRAGSPQWPARHVARGRELCAAAREHDRIVTAMALRRHKRRQAGRQLSS